MVCEFSQLIDLSVMEPTQVYGHTLDVIGTLVLPISCLEINSPNRSDHWPSIFVSLLCPVIKPHLTIRSSQIITESTAKQFAGKQNIRYLEKKINFNFLMRI